MAEQRVQQTATAALHSYQLATRHGPLVGCLVCHQAQFPSMMAEVGRVGVLAGQEERHLYIDMEFVHNNPTLFQHLGVEWCCRPCVAAMTAGRMPPMAAKNGMPAPWVSLPPALLTLTTEELETLGLSTIFTSLDGLTVGVEGEGLPTKTLYIPRLGVTSTPHLTTATKSLQEVLANHLRPPSTLPVLRADRVLLAMERLLSSHPRYKATTPAVEAVMMKDLSDGIDSEERQQPRRVVQGPSLPLDHFTTCGPRLHTLHGLLLPWRKARQSSPAANLLQIPEVMAEVAALYDLQGEAEVGREREEPLTLLQWAQQRLGHVHRGGLGSQASLVMALLFLADSQRMAEVIAAGRARQEAGEGGDERSWLVRTPGTAPYLAWVRQELEAMLRWHGPVAYFMTFTLNTASSDLMGCWVVHEAGKEGRSAAVWHREEEVARLHLRQGQASPGEEGGKFYVHQEGGEGEGEEGGEEEWSCPYHPNCSRTPLEDWRAR